MKAVILHNNKHLGIMNFFLKKDIGDIIADF